MVTPVQRKGSMTSKKNFIKALLLLFLVGSLNAKVFLDNDLDGVANEDDKCPNSQITDIVDKDGCAKDKVTFKKEQHIDVSIGVSRQKVANSSWSTSKNISLGYYYDSMNLWLTYSKYNDSTYDTLTFAAYYNLDIDKSLITFGVGSYIPTNSNKSDKTDYFLSLKYSYFFTNSSISIEYLHLFSKDLDTKDSNFLSLEYGYLLNKNLYLSISYKLESSIYKDESNRQTLGLFGNYTFDNNWYVSAQLSKDLSNSSNISYSLSVGYYY